jgi:hypothetical protein
MVVAFEIIVVGWMFAVPRPIQIQDEISSVFPISVVVAFGGSRRTKRSFTL